MSFVPPFAIHGSPDGPPLLLVAPLGRDRTSWSMQLPAFGADFRCIVFDARGIGADAEPVTRTSIEEMAQDAVAVLTELELERAHVAGVSMGAAVAAAVALAVPEKVRSLSLYTPWGRTDQWLSMGFSVLQHVARHGTLADYEAAVIWFVLSREIVDSFEDLDATISETVASPWYPAGETLIAQLDASIDVDLLDKAGAIACPTLIVAGEHDRFIPAEYARELAGRIPSARLEIIQGPGSTHGLLLERASEFNQLAVGFIKEVEGAL